LGGTWVRFPTVRRFDSANVLCFHTSLLLSCGAGHFDCAARLWIALMTKPFFQTTRCTHCGAEISTASPFSQWLRAVQELDSQKQGVVVTDLDYVIHRYKSEYGRMAQGIMVVEVKTNGAEPEAWQVDTLQLLSQLVRNDRKTPTKVRRGAVNEGLIAPTMAYSEMFGEWITLNAAGAHLLQMSGTNPEDSEWLCWDRKPITKEQLVALFRFDLHPYTLEPWSLRVHHAMNNSAMLPFKSLKHESE
jgi:hypothetical protein